ncbi:NT5C3B_2 [Blepharisma stoltei]|uniref:5'-nucleotidase n=1 Tax=Blepharisma stoltei TaxID=1481888 RepID=A0AAU9KH16_9CILI|nr:unnamed protein product [Blepharisma stoltei]
MIIPILKRGFSNFIRPLISPMNPAETVFIRDPLNLKSKIESFSSDFGIISDFDSTLTKYSVNGFKLSTINLLISILDKNHSKDVKDLFLHYHPIEIDPSISLDKKMLLMHEWWAKEQEVFLKAHIEKHMITSAIENLPFYFRYGILEVISICERNKIPFTIVSGGVGNIISEMIKAITSYQIKIKSNFIEFDENGKLLGFSTPIVHSQNKFHSIRGKKIQKSYFVLGDIPSDLLILKEINDETKVISIGYFNDEALASLDDFRDFDIVIRGDGNLSVLEYLLCLVLKLPRPSYQFLGSLGWL